MGIKNMECLLLSWPAAPIVGVKHWIQANQGFPMVFRVMGCFGMAWHGVGNFLYTKIFPIYTTHNNHGKISL